MLSYISKKIIISRLLDKGINASLQDFDNILINQNDFKDLNGMYNFIINNYKKVIIN